MLHPVVVLGVVRDVARALQIRGKGRGAGFGFAKELTTTPRHDPGANPARADSAVDGRLRTEEARPPAANPETQTAVSTGSKTRGGRTHRHTTHETPWPCEDAMEMRRRRPLRYNGNYEPQHATGATLNAGQAPSLEGAGASVE